MKIILVAFSILLLSGCTFSSTPGSLSPQQRLLIVCEGWNSVFSRIDTRDSFGVASNAEIEAVEQGIEILNPVCTQNLATARGFDIVTLEQTLLAIIASQGD